MYFSYDIGGRCLIIFMRFIYSSKSYFNLSTTTTPFKGSLKSPKYLSSLLFCFKISRYFSLLYRPPFPSHKWRDPLEIEYLNRPLKNEIYDVKLFISFWALIVSYLLVSTLLASLIMCVLFVTSIFPTTCYLCCSNILLHLLQFL